METDTVNHKPSLGLALSGSGNRTAFYIGFLEKLDKLGLRPDFISACSGASLVAAAYACGTLAKLKREVRTLAKTSDISRYVRRGNKGGGLYSLDGLEKRMRDLTLGKTFEEVRPIMSFSTVDIETGEQVDLCMGDIARAARISCTLPGIFEPVKWGNRTLVDGGLLSMVPLDSLSRFQAEVTVAVNIPGTRYIFTPGQIKMKRAADIIGKLLLVDEIGVFIKRIWDLVDHKQTDFEKHPGTWTVLRKSLDLAAKAEKLDRAIEQQCDLEIVPELPAPKSKIKAFFDPYYELGREYASRHAPAIKRLLKSRTRKETYA